MLKSVRDLRNDSGIWKYRMEGQMPNVKMLYQLYNKGLLDFEVFLPSLGLNLQRAYVWNKQQRSRLIESVLTSFFIPYISVVRIKNSQGDGDIRQVIDGKQRLLTLLKFFEGDFRINIGGDDYFFNELPKEYQTVISNFTPRCFEVQEDHNLKIVEEDKIDWFLAINDFGTPQSSDYINLLKKSLNKR